MHALWFLHETLSYPVVAPASYHSALGPLVGRVKYQQDFTPLPALVKAYLAGKGIDGCRTYLLATGLGACSFASGEAATAGLQSGLGDCIYAEQELALPLEDSLLLRIADTAPQAGLSGKARRRNLAKRLP